MLRSASGPWRHITRVAADTTSSPASPDVPPTSCAAASLWVDHSKAPRRRSAPPLRTPRRLTLDLAAANQNLRTRRLPGAHHG
jgi:hypothetical protein